MRRGGFGMTPAGGWRDKQTQDGETSSPLHDLTMRNEGSLRLLFSFGEREGTHTEARFAKSLCDLGGDLRGAGGVAVDA